MSDSVIGPYLCCICIEQGINRPGYCVPAIVVPIVQYPIPLYIRFRGAICRQHSASFNLKTFADHFGPQWYELAADHLRSLRKPAVNPYPNDPDFKFEDWIINPNFEPYPKEQCFVQFWGVGTLAAKGARQKLGKVTRQ